MMYNFIMHTSSISKEEGEGNLYGAALPMRKWSLCMTQNKVYKLLLLLCLKKNDTPPTAIHFDPFRWQKSSTQQKVRITQNMRSCVLSTIKKGEESTESSREFFSVCSSCYLVGELRTWYESKDTPDGRGHNLSSTALFARQTALPPQIEGIAHLILVLSFVVLSAVLCCVVLS